jgi:hypothetical protein
MDLFPTLNTATHQPPPIGGFSFSLCEILPRTADNAGAAGLLLHEAGGSAGLGVSLQAVETAVCTPAGGGLKKASSAMQLKEC